MTEIEKQRSFWTTMPGILTGVAAIITAVTGLYIAIHSIGNEQPKPSPPSNSTSSTTSVKSATTPNEWPLVGEQTFTEISPEWAVGSFPDKNLSRADLSFIGGKYRWDMEFLNGQEKPIYAPYGPATDFYLAVDVKFAAFTPGVVAASLLFGNALKSDYAFRISSNNQFALERFGGTKHEMIISFTPISINSKESNRMAVAVEDGRIKLYINSKLVGEYKDFQFAGGKVGISVEGWQTGQSTVVDFDNFEFRRKP